MAGETLVLGRSTWRPSTGWALVPEHPDDDMAAVAASLNSPGRPLVYRDLRAAD